MNWGKEGEGKVKGARERVASPANKLTIKRDSGEGEGGGDGEGEKLNRGAVKRFE